MTRRSSYPEIELKRPPKLDSERARQMLEPLRESDPRDLLTGLTNSGHFALSVHEAVDEARRKRTPLSLILLELDYMDRIRTHHGRNEVTRLLVEVAAVCLREVTEEQLVGRYERYQFGILLSRHFPGEGVDLAHRVLASARERVRFGANLPATLSAGCATLGDVTDWSTGGLLDLAEQRLEEARSAGGDQVVDSGRFWQDDLLTT